MPVSTNWVGYVSAGCLVALSFLAVFIVKRNRELPPVFPPILEIDVQEGYTGQHDFGAWRLVCTAETPAPAAGEAANPAPEAGSDLAASQKDAPRCHVRSQLAMRQGDKIETLAAAYIFFRPAMTQPHIAIVLPAAAKGGKSVFFGIDENKAFESPLVGCSEKQCITRGQLPEGAIEQFQSGQEFRIRFTMPDNRTPVFPMKLYGFKEAYRGLQRSLGMASPPAAATPAVPSAQPEAVAAPAPPPAAVPQP